MGLLFADSGSEISSPIFNELTQVVITSILRNIFTEYRYIQVQR